MKPEVRTLMNYVGPETEIRVFKYHYDKDLYDAETFLALVKEIHPGLGIEIFPGFVIVKIYRKTGVIHDKQVCSNQSTGKSRR